MPNTKITTTNCPKVVCAVCKKTVALAKYTEHVVRCVESRPRCEECGQTFKTAYYLKLHKGRQHKEKSQSHQTDKSEDKVEINEEMIVKDLNKRKTINKHDNLSDLGSSPDVSVRVESESEKSEGANASESDDIEENDKKNFDVDENVQLRHKQEEGNDVINLDFRSDNEAEEFDYEEEGDYVQEDTAKNDYRDEIDKKSSTDKKGTDYKNEVEMRNIVPDSNQMLSGKIIRKTTRPSAVGMIRKGLKTKPFLMKSGRNVKIKSTTEDQNTQLDIEIEKAKIELEQRKTELEIAKIQAEENRSARDFKKGVIDNLMKIIDK